MKATLIYRNKIVMEDFITEMVIWELPQKTQDRPLGIKYRLYHGNKIGRCIVRYDNESGKGDHKHVAEKEIAYKFISVEQLMKDFISDIVRLTGGGKKMRKKKMIVKTGGLEEAAKEFIDIWHQIEKQNTPQAPIEKISFQDQRLLFKTLTPKRFEILKYVHEQNGISIRALAKELGRDYSNVHQDVKILSQLGLMLKDEKNNKYYVPWDVIVTEIPLSAIKKSRAHTHPVRRAAHG